MMPSSTASPSIWWKVGVWVASGVSRRYTRPGDTMYTGGSCVSIVLIWDGDVSVRSTVSGSRKSVWTGDREGCPCGKFSASKLYRVVSTSRPSTIVYPRPRKMSSNSRRICVMRCRWPRRTGVPGIVTSTRSSVSRRSSSARRELRLARVERRLDALAKSVQRHPGLAVADLAKRELERALPAEVLDTDLLDVVGGLGCGECRECVPLERCRVHGGDCTAIGWRALVHRSSSPRRWDGCAPAESGGTATTTRAPLPRLSAGAR